MTEADPERGLDTVLVCHIDGFNGPRVSYDRSTKAVYFSSNSAGSTIIDVTEIPTLIKFLKAIHASSG